MSLPVAHALIGGALLATFRPSLDFCRPRVALAAAMILPIVPDFDFALVWLGGLPVTVWHRTFSHSLIFSAAMGLLAAVWVRRRGVGTPRAAFWFVATLVLSHALVDMCGHGHGIPGRGVTLFWPFWQKFVAFPWQFLPPGRHGQPEVYLRTAVLEFALLAPIAWLYVRALRSWRARRPQPVSGEVTAPSSETTRADAPSPAVSVPTNF